MRRVYTTRAIVLFCMVIGLGAGICQADIYHLNIFTNNGNFAGDPAMGLTFEVSAEGDDVRFEFHNDSSVDSSIASIYFHDTDTLDSIVYIDEGPGTSFSEGGSPPNLPAGNELSPVFQKPPAFVLSADNPAPTNGLNPAQPGEPDEWVAIIFNLPTGTDFSDVLDDLNDHSLRIGAHVIAFPDGSSESATTPEPATLGVMLVGSALAAFRRRKR